MRLKRFCCLEKYTATISIIQYCAPSQKYNAVCRVLTKKQVCVCYVDRSLYPLKLAM